MKAGYSNALIGLAGALTTLLGTFSIAKWVLMELGTTFGFVFLPGLSYLSQVWLMVVVYWAISKTRWGKWMSWNQIMNALDDGPSKGKK